MNTTTPQYVQPPDDPGLAILAEQNQQQQNAAIQDRASAQSAELMTRYGTRVAMSGMVAHSPLIAPALARGGVLPTAGVKG